VHHTAARSFVLAVEFRVREARRIAQLLSQHEESLRDLGAHYAFAYESLIEPGRVLVVIGIHSRQPLVELLRSRSFFDWFDAVGVDDLPAVFAGEIVQRYDIGEAQEPGTDVVVAAVTPVDDVDGFVSRVQASLDDFAKAGISRSVVYRALDTAQEVLFVQQLSNERTARWWAERSDIASDWLSAAGVGGYPPVFVGRFVHAMRLRGTDAD
jgi:hypothetical protein